MCQHQKRSGLGQAGGVGRRQNRLTPKGTVGGQREARYERDTRNRGNEVTWVVMVGRDDGRVSDKT